MVGGMFRVKTFDAIQPGGDERGNDFVRAVQARMRHHREAAGLMNQFNAFERGHLGLGHPRGPAFFQEPLERFVEVADQSVLHQRAGDVRPAGRFAIGQRENGFGLERNAQLVDGRDHLADAVLPDGLELRDARSAASDCACRENKPRMCSSVSSCSAVSSVPGMNSMPAASQAAAMRAQPSTVS